MKLTNNTTPWQANHIIILFYLALITNAFFAPVLFSYDQQLVEDSVLIKIAKYVPIIIYILLNHNQRIYNNFSSNYKLILLLSAIYIMSVLWSPTKSTTLVNAIQFFIFIWFCNIVFIQIKIDLFKTILTFLIFIVSLSWVLILLFPEQGKMAGFHGGLARGVFMHKNVLGSILVLLFPTILISGLPKVKNTILLISTIGLILYTGSSTSMITLIILLFLIPIIKKLNGGRLVIIIASTLCLVLFMFYQYSGIIFNYLGKSEDMTGRVILWNGLTDAINKHPYLGWGYFGFWGSNAKEFYLGDMEWVTGKAHNAFIDILLSGGYISLALTIAILIIILKKIFYIKDDNIRTYSLLSFVAIMLLSLTEINLFVHNNIHLFILLFISKITTSEHFISNPYKPPLNLSPLVTDRIILK